tara:strand:- start:276 stop:749 length:474 start_codon:yes stop_codon:yes gene_type:complete
MIIECINCDKKFEVNSDLIPTSGRTIQCGSCNHIWFFDPKKIVSKVKIETKIVRKTSNKSVAPENKKYYPKKEKKKNISEIENKKNYEITKYRPKKSFSLNKLLSYILVLIISFVALMIIIDTFSTPLYQKFPNLELLVFSLFETLKDIKLFIKDLI